MSYIIVWRNSHREPFIDVDSRSFKESYYSYEEALNSAAETQRVENSGGEMSPWYFDYKIYEESNN